MIYIGQKINDISEKYFVTKKKRELINEFMKIVEVENSKRKKQSAKQRKAEKARETRIAKEAEQKVAVIREKKKKIEKEKKEAPPKPKPILKIGDRVRMHDGKAVGTIDTLEKGKAIVNYGMFTTNVAIDFLELVSRT